MDDSTAKILVVDDTVDNLDLLEFALKRKPVQMLRAMSGKECLEIAKAERPDVILLDIQMPEMDGFETLKHLRAHPATAKIPVIFLTAQKKDPESIQAGFEMGADEYLTKPIDTEELLVRTKMLVRLKKAEDELERTKADFMAMLVHDLRSPLSGIKSVVDILTGLDVNTPLGEEYMELLKAAQVSSQRMLELINDLLDVSKFASGNITLERETVQLPLIVDAVCKQMTIQFKQRNITLQKHFDDNLPTVSVDVALVGQVLMNLLSNALKFTKEGGDVRIKAFMNSTVPTGPDGARKAISISVSDTGIGIGPDELKLIFEKYRQVSSAKKTKQKGTGLGLAICKLIAEAHGGYIVAESQMGVGTTFTITLPLTANQ